jgi:hypothetical protein
MNTPHPYEEKRFDNGLILREFKHNANVEDLIWHQDKKDRKVFVVESNGWKLQLSNGLPFPLIEGKEYFIPKKSWHRVIKGNGNLKIEIHERDDKVKITESQLRQQVKFLLKEEVYGTIATVYHGSKQPPEEFLKLFETGDGSSYASTGWLPGKGVGSAYGHGMYSVWMKTDHKTFRGDYGEWIYKLKVNLYGFIIFDETICQKVYGESITPLEQMKLIGKEQELRKASEKELEILSTPPIKGARSAGIAQGSSNFLKSRVNGIVFFGDNDGPVVLVYDPDIATPIAWTKLEITTKSLGHWTLWNASEIKQSLNRASHAGTHADTKRLQSQHLDVRKFINRESSFKKLYDTLSTQNKDIFALESQNSEILTQLSKDKDVQIRRHVAKNKYLPIELLIQFSKENDEGIRAAVAQNQSTPNEVFLQFVNDKKASVREILASSHKISVEALLKLAKDKNTFVRSEVAKNSKVTPQILAKLARDESKVVRHNVAFNPQVQPETLAQLSGDKEVSVRVAVATIRKTPTEVLTQLAGDENDRVRSKVANNPSTPTEALVQLFRDKDVSVRTGVVNNPNTSAELLVQLAEDNEPWIRYYASNHKNATIEVLEKLSNDRNNMIQKSAADKLQALKQLNELKRIIKYCI